MREGTLSCVSPVGDTQETVPSDDKLSHARDRDPRRRRHDGRRAARRRRRRPYRAGLERGARRRLRGARRAAAAASMPSPTAVRLLEDNPLFNAGRGAVLTHDGTARARRLDHGRPPPARRRGRGPAPRAQPDRPRAPRHGASPHVMLHGTGAEEFAIEQGFDAGAEQLVPDTVAARAARARAAGPQAEPRNELQGLGTVGAVALDRTATSPPPPRPAA